MKSVVAIIVLLLILIGGYSLTGNVIAGEDDEAPGIFEKIWNWFKGLFSSDEKIELSSVNTTARVAVDISSNGIEDLDE